MCVCVPACVYLCIYLSLLCRLKSHFLIDQGSEFMGPSESSNNRILFIKYRKIDHGRIVTGRKYLHLAAASWLSSNASINHPLIQPYSITIWLLIAGSMDLKFGAHIKRTIISPTNWRSRSQVKVWKFDLKCFHSQPIIWSKVKVIRVKVKVTRSILWRARLTLR